MLRALLCTLLLVLAPLSYAELDERIVVVIEEPAQGEYYSGISNLRGYAVSPEGTGRYYHSVYIDGEFAFYITPYGKRADVGNAFPDYPDSDTGGFSMAFNYKSLSPGEHEIRVRAYDDAGNYNDAVTTFTAERFETEFIASDSDVDVSTSQTWSIIDKQTYLVSGATLEGKQWDFLLKWDRASQSFKMEGILPFGSDTAGSTSGAASGSTDSSDSEDCPGPGYDCWYSDTDGSSGDSGTDTTTGGNTSGTDDSSGSSSGSSDSGGGSGTSSGASDNGSTSDTTGSSSGNSSTDSSSAQSPFAAGKQAAYRVEYWEDNPYTIDFNSSCDVDVCHDYEMTLSFADAARQEGGKPVVYASYDSYDGLRVLEFFTDEEGNLRQLKTWDGKYDIYNYALGAWGAVFIPSTQANSDFGTYDVGMGQRGDEYAVTLEEGSLRDLGQREVTSEAFTKPIVARLIYLQTQVTWAQGTVSWPEGSVAEVVQETLWSEEYGIISLERRSKIYERTITGSFLNPVEVFERWDMTSSQ